MKKSMLFLVAAACGLALSLPVHAQSNKPVPGFADYGKWETMSLTGSVAGANSGGGGRGGGRFGGGGGGLSADGQWLGVNISRTNTERELRLINLATKKVEAEPYGAGLTYSADSKWAAWSIGYSTVQSDRMRQQNQPVQNKLALYNLSTGDKKIVDGVQSFTFSPDSQFIAMRRYAPPPPSNAGAGNAGTGRGGRGGGAPGGATIGVTVIVRNLSTGADMTFGNVDESAWRDTGATLAMTISAAEKAGNGVQLYDAATGTLRVLDSHPTTYSGLTWRDGAADLAVLRAKADDKKDGDTFVVMAWTGLGSAGEKSQTYDPTTDAKFPAGQRIVSFRNPSWSEDGKSIELGFAAWDDKATPAAPQRGRGAGANGDTNPNPDPGPADVVVWHWKDTTVMSRQQIAAPGDRRRNLLGIWHLDSTAFTPIGKSFEESIQVLDGDKTALAYEWQPYAMARSIGRGFEDLALVDLTTGQRTPLKAKLNGTVQPSPSGKYVLFSDAGDYWTINTSTRQIVNITKPLGATFRNTTSDSTSPSIPMFGTGGWTTGDAAVLVYDEFDIWQVAPDGSGGKKLTDGRAEQVRHRIVTVTPTSDGIDLSQPQYVALFGDRSKKSGYGRLKPGGGVDRLIFADRAVSQLAKAKDADVYVHVEQNYDDSPDAFITDASLANGTQVTNTNAFQSNYAWGRSETIDFKTDKIHNNGEALQATLYYPAGYDPSKQYPMIVYIYETLSDNVHQYVAPTDRNYYNTSVWTTQGYFVLQPDITFRPKEPGLSVVECVVPAVKAALAKASINPKGLGVIGHSWGGFDTAFLATHTQGVFAAAVAGAAITNLVSNYGDGHWSSGIAETDHIETGQQRMAVPLYDDLQAYIRNSAVYNIQNMTVPLMLEVGNDDGTVFWHQGVEMYNIARRAGKNVVMIEYDGEDHGLGEYKNQKDYQQRILQWFGHYLKGEPGPAWITEGQSYLERQKEKQGGRGGVR